MAAYGGPMIDTHHHIWLRKDVAWLADPPIPRMFGDYFGIRRDYPVEEFIQDVSSVRVTKSVHATAMWGSTRALDESKWLQATADRLGFPHGIVCNANLADPDIEDALKAQKQFPNLRGVRQMLYWDGIRRGRARLAPISATMGISAAASRCWKSTICISNCRSFPPKHHTRPSCSRRSPTRA